MEEMNSLEMRLRSWEPRRPAADLERRIFGTEHRPRSRRSPGMLAFGWLAPAAACVLLAVTLNRPEGGLSTGHSPAPIALMVRSNQAQASSVSQSNLPSQPALSPALFEWTNRSDSTSSIHSLLPAN